MQRFRMMVSYDGSAYSGWQVQPHKRTIQGEIERALQKITTEKIRIHSSGRTDAGVHAKGQVAHFDLAAKRGPERLLSGLNALLDRDIRVLSLKPAKPDFHARFSAVGKEYRYFIWTGEVLPPFLHRYRAHVSHPLDAEAMQKAARQLQGRHDFAPFSARPNREVDGTVRHLQKLSVQRAGPEMTIVAVGDGFLYKMVRSLAGFLIRVGEGAVASKEARAILSSRVRTGRVPTAPPKGLFLWRVSY